MVLITSGSSILLVQLAVPALRGIALAGAAGLGLAAFRVKSTSQRLFTWTAVLYAALAIPLLRPCAVMAESHCSKTSILFATG